MKTLTILLVLAGLVACEKKDEHGTTPTGSTSAAVTASAAPSASAAPTASAAATTTAVDEEVADEEDYAEQVSKSIDEKNYESELDKLEKEIGK